MDITTAVVSGTTIPISISAFLNASTILFERFEEHLALPGFEMHIYLLI
jgi:hypothetical protein